MGVSVEHVREAEVDDLEIGIEVGDGADPAEVANILATRDSLEAYHAKKAGGVGRARGIDGDAELAAGGAHDLLKCEAKRSHVEAVEHHDHIVVGVGVRIRVRVGAGVGAGDGDLLRADGVQATE